MKSIDLESNIDINLSSYDFLLPDNLIAKTPLMPKENAKLLVYKNGVITHTIFKYLFDFIPKDYLIVLNNTKVINARIFAKKLNKDIIDSIKHNVAINCNKEIFYHRHIDKYKHLTQIKGRVKLYDCFIIPYKSIYVGIQVVGIIGEYREVIFFYITRDTINSFLESKYYIQDNKPLYNLISNQILDNNAIFDLLQECGKIPLPPYIRRDINKKDEIDYQSVFANIYGSVAAPTASLHFSKNMLEFLKKTYNHLFITLHVGAGTFKPVIKENILEHKIHSEMCCILQDDANKILKNNNILCIGTTALRSIEWFIKTHKLCGENDIFLHPLNKPKKVKALLTNFHLPKSSLIMLVSSLIGREQTLKIYNEAIKQQYRFYSYGDGMLII